MFEVSDPIELAILVVTIVAVALGLIQFTLSWSFNVTSRERWLQYLSFQNPRFKEFYDVVMAEEVGGHWYRSGITLRVLLPYCAAAFSPFVWIFFLAGVSDDIDVIYFLAIGAAVVLTSIAQRRRLLRLVTNEDNLQRFALASVASKLTGPDRQFVTSFSGLVTQRVLGPIYTIEPFLLASVVLSAIFAYPWNLAALIIALSTIGIGEFLWVRYTLFTRYEAEDALFGALRKGFPPLVIHADILHTSGGQYPDEEIVSVGPVIRSKGPEGRVLVLQWKKIEAIGVRPNEHVDDA
jgi:hypothetical protein